MKASRRLDVIDRMISELADHRIVHRVGEESSVTGARVCLDGRELINFASCSYLGLDLDPRLIEGAVEAVRAHGVETSCSRAYLSSPLYLELEQLVESVFGAHVVISPTTTLGHLAAMPVLITEEDAMVMDHQVHTSVQVAAQFVKSTSAAHLEMVRHNDMAQLEERVAELSKRHRFVWYLADGVYSMFGDRSPNAELVRMMEDHPQMRVYVDDAHGMSWAGPNGSGTVMEEVGLHPQMVLVTGMAKGFGPGGGLIVLPDEEQKRRIRTCGPTLIFGGPLQPPVLGAAIASAKIHLSPEIETLQADLADRMAYCNALLEEAQLPVISAPDTPVGFVGMGSVGACQAICARLLEEGLFTNPAQFPAAPMRRGGMRFLLTRHHSRIDIEQLVTSAAKHWAAAVRAGGATPEEVWNTFGLEKPEAKQSPKTALEPVDAGASEASELVLERADTIGKFDAREWDAMAAHRGCMSSSALTFFERVFGENDDPTQKWDFRYYVVRDAAGEAILSTFFTKALWKADMLSPSNVSRRIEAERVERNDPLYLTQDVFGQGCLLSEGNHLWLREAADHPTSQEALKLMLKAMRADAQILGCEVRVLRDVPATEETLLGFFESDGFLRMPAPESLVVEDAMESEEALVASLSKKSRYHYRRSIEPYRDAYCAEVIGPEDAPLTPEVAEGLERLYQNVKDQSLDLNTFDLPTGFFSQLARSPDWEIVVLRPAADPDSLPVGFFAAYGGQPDYVPLVAGLDYDYVAESGLYRQILQHAIERARTRGQKRLLLGMGASLEKRRVGAQVEESFIMMEADDAYAFDAVAHFEADSN